MKNILFFLTILLFSCDSPIFKKEPKAEVKIESDSLQDLGSQGIEPSNEVSTNLDSNAPRYWYVSYYSRRKSDNSEWRGYKVIEMNESYFDVYKAIKIIYPSWIDGDYVEIGFFKEVSEKTYVEFNNVESPK